LGIAWETRAVEAKEVWAKTGGTGDSVGTLDVTSLMVSLTRLRTKRGKPVRFTNT